MRCSIPGIPFGIFEKSPRPISFCSLKQNGQWSVETMLRSLVRSPRHRCAQCSLGRTGGEQTYLAPSNPGASRSSWDRYRYWGQVSANTLRPSSRASMTAWSACWALRWTMYSGAPVTWASLIALAVASPSSSGGLVRPCQPGSVPPLASACATSTSIAMPFSEIGDLGKPDRPGGGLPFQFGWPGAAVPARVGAPAGQRLRDEHVDRDAVLRDR